MGASCGCSSGVSNCASFSCSGIKGQQQLQQQQEQQQQQQQQQLTLGDDPKFPPELQITLDHTLFQQQQQQDQPEEEQSPSAELLTNAEGEPEQEKQGNALPPDEAVLPRCVPVRLESNAKAAEPSSSASLAANTGKRSVTGSRIFKAITGSRSTHPAKQETARRAGQLSGNANRPQDYKWLEGTLQALARNEGGRLGCKDTTTGKHFFPMFFVIGGCPNMWCGMQSVMYCVSGEKDVDFWWVKPSKCTDGAENSTDIERHTLSRHAKGPHKNDPGRSKQFLKPLAEFFEKGERLTDGTRFGIDRVGSDNPEDGGRVLRAFLDRPAPAGEEVPGTSNRSYVFLVWQEDWGSNIFTRSHYIKGKLVYQKDPKTNQFYARQYAINNNNISLCDAEEQLVSSVLPDDCIKELA